MAKTWVGLILISCLASEARAEMIPSGLIELGKEGVHSPYAIVVDKQSRKLTVWKQEKDKLIQVLETPSDIGKKTGNKSQLGDERTPESIYFFEKELSGPSLLFEKYGQRAYTMNYPNLFDERDGKTGYGIWLHAIPDTESLERGSRGCVVVRNDSITEVGKFIELGQTPILIYDSVKWIPASQRKNQKETLEKWLGRWIEAWSTKATDQYMGFYAADFRSQGMNHQQWRRFKESLNSKYKTIQIEMMNPVILEHGQHAIVKMLQRYRSDLHQDFGEKVLHLRKEPSGEYKILAEEWRARAEPPQETLAKCCL